MSTDDLASWSQSVAVRSWLSLDKPLWRGEFDSNTWAFHQSKRTKPDNQCQGSRVDSIPQGVDFLTGDGHTRRRGIKSMDCGTTAARIKS